MLAVAGGILIAIFVLVFFRWIILGTMWALLVGGCLLAAIVGWLILSQSVGDIWATVIIAELAVAAMVWFGEHEAEQSDAMRLLGSVLVLPLLASALCIMLVMASAGITIFAVFMWGMTLVAEWVFGPAGFFVGIMTASVLVIGAIHMIERRWSGSHDADNEAKPPVAKIFGSKLKQRSIFRSKILGRN